MEFLTLQCNRHQVGRNIQLDFSIKVWKSFWDWDFPKSDISESNTEIWPPTHNLELVRFESANVEIFEFEKKLTLRYDQ